MAPTLSIIILNWNTADLLAACLASLAQVTVAHEVIVVDNGSADGSAAMVRERFPAVTLLALPDNLGFARGNNAGLGVAQGRYLLLLNPDTEVRAGCLESLVAFMEAHPTIGIAGPTLWNPDGSLQPSLLHVPTLRLEFLRQTMLFRLLPAERQPSHPHPVEGVTGAALLIRRACLEQIGPLDPAIFMFYEDTDWCRRATEAGWAVWFVPCEGIMHVKSAASSRFARTRTLLDSQRSTIYYFQKHHGPRAVALLRGITLCGSAARALRAAVQWLRGRDRADQQQRLNAYGRMARWALTGRGLDGKAP